MSHPQRRGDPRLKVTIRARLRDSRRIRDICILDVSARGFLATAGTPPPRGEFVEINIGPAALIGQVRWAGEHRFGIGLQDRIDVGAISQGKYSDFRARVTRMQEREKGHERRLEVAAERSGRLARLANWALAAIACGAAALYLADAVGDNLGSLDKAGDAMNGSVANFRQR